MSRGSTIPNIFHFVFGLRKQPETFHLMHYLCLVSCIEVNRPDAVHFHFKHEPLGPWWERIKHKLVLRHVEPEAWVADFNYSDPRIAPFRYAHLADFARLRILAEEGGIYADIDTLFLRPIPSEWLSRQFILGREKPPLEAGQDGSLCNAWIASAPDAEFGRRWLDAMGDAFDGTWSNHSTLLPYRLAQQFPDLLHIEPATSFYAEDWTPEGIANLFRRNVSVPDNAYSLHLWSHLWFDEDRRDFSDFHQGLLTPDYVSHADATYAVNARQYLPAELRGTLPNYWLQNASSVLRHPLAAARSLMGRR